MYSIILCGGSGTRLWPLSRKNYPKQFLRIYNDNSLLQETYLRMKEIVPADNIYFVTNEVNSFNVINQIKDIDKDFKKENVLIEPASRNTAPAITFAIKHLAEKVKINLDAPIFEAHSDHFIGNQDTYIATAKKAMAGVDGHIGTIGITPTKPDTGLGYIKKGEFQNGYYEVEKFVEKPNLDTAKQYVESGQYLWNSGMYIFSIKTYVKELKKHAPDVFKMLNQNFDVFLKNFDKMPNVAIDVAISEKSDNIVVFEGDFGWCDVGSFDMIAEINAGKSNPRHISIDSKNIFVHSENNRLVTTLGVEDLIIVENNDSILVKKRGQSDKIKEVVNYMKANNYPEIDHNIIVHRPWGKYEMLIEAPHHKVKRLTIYPGEKINMHSHYHRAEHWIVVNGIAKVANGSHEIVLRENESTFISKYSKHTLENPGKINLEIIEVSTGNYLNEDDTLRFDNIKNSIE